SQGWGPWEVNLSQVLNYANNNAPQNDPLLQGGPFANTPLPREWINLFNGRSSSSYGRYGPDGQPGQDGSVAARPTSPPRFFSAMNLDGTKSPAHYPSDPLALPTSAFPFPSYPPSSFGNGDSTPGAADNYELI